MYGDPSMYKIYFKRWQKILYYMSLQNVKKTKIPNGWPTRRTQRYQMQYQVSNDVGRYRCGKDDITPKIMLIKEDCCKNRKHQVKEGHFQITKILICCKNFEM